MDNVDLNVLRQVTQWLSSGHRVVLGTIVRTWGSVSYTHLTLPTNREV